MSAPLHAIVALSENRVIGQGSRIPWHLPLDFRWFKHQTQGATLVLGRKTYEAIGRPLPGRTSLVLTRQALPPVAGVHAFVTPEALEQALPLERVSWIAGGAEIYRLFLPRCTLLYLTRVKREVTGDVFFPPFEEQFTFDQLIFENIDFRVERWAANGQARPAPEAWPFG